MPPKQIVAYFMRDEERNAASKIMHIAETTPSFLVGEVDDKDLDKLRTTGVIVQVLQMSAPQPESLLATGISTRQPWKGATASIGTESATEAVAQPPIPSLVHYYYVALRGPLLESWRQRLQAIGAILLEAVPGKGYKARLTMDQLSPLKALDFVESVKWISPEPSAVYVETVSIVGRPGEQPRRGLKMLTFDVRLHAPDDRPKIEQWLAKRNVAISGSSGRKIRFFLLQGSPVLSDLAQQPEVDVVAEYREPRLWNDFSRRLLGVDAEPGHTPTTNLTEDGSGQIVAVADTGIDDQHPDFQGRIVGTVARGRPNDTTDPNGHGTHVAGSVLGDGSASGGKIKGIAPKAKLFFQSLLDANGGLGGLPLDLNDLFEEAYQAGARIHNNSWGSATPSSYTINSEEVDEFVRQHPDMLILIAAGNEGTARRPIKSTPGFVDWLSIGSPASSKNALTVGASRSSRTDGALGGSTWGTGWPGLFPNPPIANEKISGDPMCLAAFSSRGPCDDRRIKPDVVAPGTDIVSTRSALAPITNFWGPYPTPPQQPNNSKYAFDGGTSMATPLVAGCAALVRQYYVETRNHEPSAALLKATIINSTVWLSGADSTAPTRGVPNYHQGYGRVSLSLAFPNHSQPGLNLEYIDDWKNSTRSFQITGDTRRFQFNLLQSAPELRICMAYTDVPVRALQNNLNLIVMHVDSGTKWLGNASLPDALIFPDPDNNVETVRIATPLQGNYLVQVLVGNMLKPPQDFALVVTAVGLPALTEI